MTLLGVIDLVNAHEKELALFNLETPRAVAAETTAHLGTRNVRVRTARTASGAPAGVAVLSNDDGVLAVADSEALLERFGAKRTPSTPSESGPSPADDVVSALRETTFTSSDRRQLLSASRELEDRAYRVGRGTIHAGFQRVSIMTDQEFIYRSLTSRGVSVHAYGIPDADPPSLGTGRVHAVESDELAATWFVVFDGDGDDTQKSALLAVETQPGSFYGVLTYDPQIVDTVCTHLEETYCTSAADARSRSKR